MSSIETGGLFPANREGIAGVTPEEREAFEREVETGLAETEHVHSDEETAAVITEEPQDDPTIAQLESIQRLHWETLIQ